MLLAAGLVFTFAIVVMPGIKRLGDLAFLTSFKAMDGVIQNNQPIFMLVWLGSALVLLVSTVLGIWQLEGLDRILLIVACAIYLFGVQLPTVAIDVPLNNRLQSRDLDAMTEPALLETAARFESRWVRWNAIRTVLAILTTALGSRIKSGMTFRRFACDPINLDSLVKSRSRKYLPQPIVLSWWYRHYILYPKI